MMSTMVMDRNILKHTSLINDFTLKYIIISSETSILE